MENNGKFLTTFSVIVGEMVTTSHMARLPWWNGRPWSTPHTAEGFSAGANEARCWRTQVKGRWECSKQKGGCLSPYAELGMLLNSGCLPNPSKTLAPFPAPLEINEQTNQRKDIYLKKRRKKKKPWVEDTISSLENQKTPSMGKAERQAGSRPWKSLASKSKANVVQVFKLQY